MITVYHKWHMPSTVVAAQETRGVIIEELKLVQKERFRALAYFTLGVICTNVAAWGTYTNQISYIRFHICVYVSGYAILILERTIHEGSNIYNYYDFCVTFSEEWEW